eukprot:12927165-Prorocentrum_lima.AAC.1
MDPEAQDDDDGAHPRDVRVQTAPRRDADDSVHMQPLQQNTLTPSQQNVLLLPDTRKDMALGKS